MKLNLNKKAIAIALSLALATPIISATALPTLSVFAGGFASNPAVAQGHAMQFLIQTLLIFQEIL